jgi:ParB-like chromosome segregation protein Spo0J
MGIPFSRWGAQPFITYPIPYPADYLEQASTRRQPHPARQEPPNNPIRLALSWRKMLDADSTLTRSKLAKNVGVSRARVTQIMNLLRLPEPVISHVAPLTAQKDLRVFSERHLRLILATNGTAAQVAAFRKLCGRIAE